MKVYLTHSTGYDYTTELYDPIEQTIGREFGIFYPHKSDSQGVQSRDIIASSDVVIAEVSYPSTGQGIELGWAYDSKIPVICFYQAGAKTSGALQFICDTFIEYASSQDMTNKLRIALYAKDSPLHTS